LIGKTVSHYHILEQIGQGGMSSVFRAVDLRDERAVAVKVLSPYIANEPRFRARFAREVKLLHRMDHPNIMPILDFGEVDGLAYIIMPYISSGTLQDRLARGPVEPGEATTVVAQLASALQCAHDRGVIHRDVKPSNILLDPQGNVLLSDFSFAHQADASQNLTGSALVGTPAYMAPEQCRGEPIDARSDQYAMAVVLYQMATGQLPFEADTPMGVALKHINEPLPRPTQLNPNLPPEIEMVLVKGLAKDPNLRFGSVTALGEAFRQAIAIALDPSLRTRTVNLHRTSEITKVPECPAWRSAGVERSAVVAALFVLIACPARRPAAFFFPA
jgi:serine/threonine protein kinase